MPSRRAHESIRSVPFSPGRFESMSPTTPGIDVALLSDLPKRYGREEFIGPQRPNFSILLFVTSGQATHTLDFTPYRLEAGDLLWIRSGQVQEWGRLEDLCGQVISFDSHALPPDTWPIVDSVRPRSHWPAVLSTNRQVSAAAAFISAVADGTIGSATGRAAALAHAIAALLISLTVADSCHEGEPELPGSARDFTLFMNTVETLISAAPGTQTVAHAMGVSPKTLDRLARAYTGRSAKKNIDDRVILEAKRLLVHTGAPVATIGRQLGYPDSGNFSRYFRRITNTTPAQFRYSHQHTT